MKMSKIFFALSLLTIGIGTVSAQSHITDSLVKRFDQYRRNEYTEKVYLHVNQSSFLVGETVWFSVYAVDGSRHQGTQLSKVVYVEILDASNVAVSQGKIALNEGHGNGTFYLSPLINSGNYVIRAYTSWMRNQSASY